MIQVEEAAVKSQEVFEQLSAYIKTMAEQAEEAHRVEQGNWDYVLKLGLVFLSEYFARVGDGDAGEQLRLCDGRFLPQDRKAPHTKRYVSVFGPLEGKRMCYGEGKIEAVPLDAKLNLPKSEYSYLLQDWSQSFDVHDSFGETVVKIEKLLHLGTSVRTLENLNQDIAESVENFQATHVLPEPLEEGALLVAAVDGKGVPLRREKSQKDTGRHRLRKGEKANKKKIACVGTVYTIDRFPRKVEDVIDEVMHEQAQQRRPRPQHKHVQAHLIKGKEGTFSWINEEIAARNPGGEKPVVFLGDGERAIWSAKEAYLQSSVEVVEVLDLFHVTEKLWLCAPCFHKEGSSQAEAFVEHRLRMLLQGKVSGVISGLGQMATKHRLKGKEKKTLEQVTGYFRRNKKRMRYDQYLAEGYPIGSGVVEGACRHLVKDRMERTGMRWSLQGAQAMLDLRAVYLNDEWEPFWEYHIHQQYELLYAQIPQANIISLPQAA